MSARGARLAGALALALLCGSTPSDDSPCLDRGTSVVVLTSKHALWLCKDGKAVTSYSVALGRGGTGKTREGDRRTPLGRYTLGVPRRSQRFAVFVPIGYPTAEQRRQGFTGGDIGIHGPPVDSRDVLKLASDWTDGCVAARRAADAAEVASWVSSERPHDVIIE